jgi:hypothetical protein
MKHEYWIEIFNDEKWWKGIQGSRQFCEGYLYAIKNNAPRLAHKLVRSDGKAIQEVLEEKDVYIGQVAGWPSAEQYERAAQRALDKAEYIREKNSTSSRNRA